MEIWKPVRGKEGKYEISSLGRIRSLDRIIEFETHNQFGPYIIKRLFKGKILNLKKSNSGYLAAPIDNNEYYIHRLVCEAFIRPLQSKEEVNHKDGNKLNNYVDNLEIYDRNHNQQHAFDNNISEIPGGFKVKVNGIVYDSLGEASKNTGLNKSTLSRRLKNSNIKTTGNFRHYFTIERI